MSRPDGAKQFQRLLQRHAQDIGELPQRVMHLVRVGVVCAMLDRVRHEDGAHLFIVKGGTAMQLRLGVSARATTDLDMTFRGAAKAWLAAFDEATVDRSWEGFTIVRKGAPVQIEVDGLAYRPWRVGLQIRYEGRDFGSTSLEVGVDPSGTPVHDLVEPQGIALGAFGIGPPGLVPCLDVLHQIAQKLHACTEPVELGNNRVRDVVDIWLLEAFLEPEDLPELRAISVSTFDHRGRHSWPPTVEPSASWAHDYPLLVADHPEAPQTLGEAVDYLTNLIARIDQSTSSA